MIRPNPLSLIILALAGCASGGDSWPGGEPAAVYAPEEATPAPSAAAAVPTTDVNAEAQAPQEAEAIVAADASTTVIPQASETDSRVVTAEQLKEVFDPVKTRAYVPAYDFDESLVTFEFNSAEVAPSSMPQIDQIGMFFQDPQNEGRTFALEGHTDAVGDADYNLELSKKRAEAIKALILAKFPSVYPAITVVGKGENDLKDPAAERSRVNRRVVLKEVK